MPLTSVFIILREEQIRRLNLHLSVVYLRMKAKLTDGNDRQQVNSFPEVRPSLTEYSLQVKTMFVLSDVTIVTGHSVYRPTVRQVSYCVERTSEYFS